MGDLHGTGDLAGFLEEGPAMAAAHRLRRHEHQREIGGAAVDAVDLHDGAGLACLIQRHPDIA